MTKALFPLAGSFTEQVDKKMTTFSGSIHKDNWDEYLGIALNNEEEFGKERLQANVFAGTPYGHPVFGTLKGIESMTLDDVKTFYRQADAQGAVRVGISGDVSEDMIAALKNKLARLPAGAGLSATGVPQDRRPEGLEVEIIEKNTRATAISFGLPLEVTRSHPDFPALWLAKTWLGEHRASSSHLYQQIRELRGMNYGDYAYIEAFPRGMFQLCGQAAGGARRGQADRRNEAWHQAGERENHAGGPGLRRVNLAQDVQRAPAGALCTSTAGWPYLVILFQP